MGTKAGLRHARYDLQRVWSRLPADGPLGSRIALKLGDLNFRLGDSDNALAWWARCFLMMSSPQPITQTTPLPSVIPVIPSRHPRRRQGSASLHPLSCPSPLSMQRLDNWPKRNLWKNPRLVSFAPFSLLTYLHLPPHRKHTIHYKSSIVPHWYHFT